MLHGGHRDFMKSPYVYTDGWGWHVKDDAPDEVRREVEEWRREDERVAKTRRDRGVVL